MTDEMPMQPKLGDLLKRLLQVQATAQAQGLAGFDLFVPSSK